MVAQDADSPVLSDGHPRMRPVVAPLARLHRAEEEFREGSPWRLEHEHDMRAARYRVRATLVRPAPPEFLALVAEVLRALRTVLDDVSTSLAGRTTRFPIHETLAEFAQRSRKPLAAMPDDAQASIEACQPYHEIGGYRQGSLWILRELDEAPAVYLAAGAVGAGATFGVNTRRKVDLVGEPAIVTGAFDDGAVIAEAVTKIVGPDPKLDMFFTARIAPAFARRGPGRGREVADLLAMLAEHVAAVASIASLGG